MTPEEREFPPTVREIEEVITKRGKILGHVELEKLPTELAKKLRRLQVTIMFKKTTIIRPVNLALIPLNIHTPEIALGAMSAEMAARIGDYHTEQSIREAAQLFARHSTHPEIARMLGMDEKPTHLLAWRRKLYFVKAPKKYEGKVYTPFMRQPRIPIPK